MSDSFGLRALSLKKKGHVPEQQKTRLRNLRRLLQTRLKNVHNGYSILIYSIVPLEEGTNKLQSMNATLTLIEPTTNTYCLHPQCDAL